MLAMLFLFSQAVAWFAHKALLKRQEQASSRAPASRSRGVLVLARYDYVRFQSRVARTLRGECMPREMC